MPRLVGTSRRQTAGFLVRRTIVRLRTNPCFSPQKARDPRLDLAKMSFLNWKPVVTTVILLDRHSNLTKEKKQ
jgi:hypothetical protein